MALTLNEVLIPTINNKDTVVKLEKLTKNEFIKYEMVSDVIEHEGLQETSNYIAMTITERPGISLELTVKKTASANSNGSSLSVGVTETFSAVITMDNDFIINCLDASPKPALRSVMSGCVQTLGNLKKLKAEVVLDLFVAVADTCYIDKHAKRNTDKYHITSYCNKALKAAKVDVSKLTDKFEIKESKKEVAEPAIIVDPTFDLLKFDFEEHDPAPVKVCSDILNLDIIF